MRQYIPAVHFIKRHIVPILDGVTREEYRRKYEYQYNVQEMLVNHGYIYTTQGGCCRIYIKPGHKHLIKLFMYAGLDLPLTTNPTRRMWYDMRRAGLTGSYEVAKKLPVKIPYDVNELRTQGFLPALVEHFLFYDYVHPEGLVGVQKLIDASPEARHQAEKKFGNKYNHTGNYGMDGDRPVIIDWY